MKILLTLLFFIAGFVYAQGIDSLSRARIVADSITISHIGSDLFNGHWVYKSVFIEKSHYVIPDGKGGYQPEDLYKVVYELHFYGLVDTWIVSLESDFKLSRSMADPEIADSLQNSIQHPIISKQAYKKALRKQHANKSGRSFEFWKEGIIAFFQCRKKKKDKPYPYCVWVNAINLHTGEVSTGHWWCSEN